MRSEVRNHRAARNAIALIKFKGIFKHVLTEPHAGEGVEQAFVKVVCDATTILNFTKHVMHRDPRHTLRGGREEKMSPIKQIDTQNGLHYETVVCILETDIITRFAHGKGSIVVL